MFVEHAFDVKHLGSGVAAGGLVTPLRDDRCMALAPVHRLAPVAAPVGAGTTPAPRAVRLPEAVYRRRRAVAAAVAVAVVTLALVAGRPDRVPVGEANPWPSTGAVSLSSELPGVYVVQPGDTLWDIARGLAPDRDPRVMVHELSGTAGGAALVPGQTIVIDAAGGLALYDGRGSAQRTAGSGGSGT